MNNKQTRKQDEQTADPTMYETIHGFALDPSEMISGIREIIDLHEILAPHGHTKKVRSLSLILDHELLRLAAVAPRTAADARLKAAFLTDVLAAKSLPQSPLAKAIIVAALTFEADLCRSLPATHH